MNNRGFPPPIADDPAGIPDARSSEWSEAVSRGAVSMTTRCEGCGSELKEGVGRFCGEECRRLFTEKLRRGTPSHPGRRAARRRRRRGR